MLKTIKPLTIAAIVAAYAGIAAPGLARNADTVTYTVEPGDTLYDITETYLVDGVNPARLQEMNRVRNPRRLSINRTLTIPRNLLKYELVELAVGDWTGPVTIDGSTPVRGTVLPVGAEIVTQRNGFITFTGSFGGRISLPSNTTAVLERARRYRLYNTLDVDFDVQRGRANATSPTLNGQDRLRMRTPIATTAVRGTEFRVAYDPENSDVSLTEVTEGAVQVAAGGATQPAPAGFGVSSSSSGVGEPEALLPAPAFIDLGAVQTEEALTFAFEPVDGAQGYRVQLARDLTFLDILAERIVTDQVAVFESVENGRYHLRGRAISSSGLEGLSVSDGETSFLRKRVGVTADSENSADLDAYIFRWLTAGGEGATFAFQLWLEDAPENLLVDEVGLTSNEIALSNLAIGKYAWRVAATETDPIDGMIKIWGPSTPLTVSN
ncbi:LysM peptidoglycan-binding domain-containing protein [Erythrobacter sp. Alg231-14]|uniref:LysM peptidoglycan-binding domain-containing protein n=1 Tax=Erythrobacter sp. Alg231-14 TaxID=1922225 RepID=UPI00307C6205